MKTYPQTLSLAVLAGATLISMSPSRSGEYLDLTPGMARSLVLEGATAGNFTSIIGDPNIADVTFGPKNTFWFVGKREGRTNIIVLDNKTGREMYSAIIQVSFSVGRVNIHSSDTIASFRVYRCDPVCEYEKEVSTGETVTLPTPNLQPNTENAGNGMPSRTLTRGATQ